MQNCVTRNQASGTEDTNAMFEAMEMIANFSERSLNFGFSGQPESYRNDEVRK